jgi:hypothetical protein
VAGAVVTVVAVVTGAAVVVTVVEKMIVAQSEQIGRNAGERRQTGSATVARIDQCVVR